MGPLSSSTDLRCARGSAPLGTIGVGVFLQPRVLDVRYVDTGRGSVTLEECDLSESRTYPTPDGCPAIGSVRAVTVSGTDSHVATVLPLTRELLGGNEITGSYGTVFVRWQCVWSQSTYGVTFSELDASSSTSPIRPGPVSTLTLTLDTSGVVGPSPVTAAGDIPVSTDNPGGHPLKTYYVTRPGATTLVDVGSLFDSSGAGAVSYRVRQVCASSDATCLSDPGAGLNLAECTLSGGCYVPGLEESQPAEPEWTGCLHDGSVWGTWGCG